MDTLTHTLAGVLLGETAARVLPERGDGLTGQRRNALYVALLAVGSNLPDSDFIYSLLTRSKLDYLLHHRGHSHTIVGVLLAATLLFCAAELWIRRQRWHATAADRRWLVLLALLGPVLHVAMDSTNTYGVHPFWPFNNHWSYGDSIFIIEPLLWAAAIPLFGTMQNRKLRLVLAVLLIAALAWMLSTQLFTAGPRLAIAAVMLVLLILGRLTTPTRALLLAIACWCGITVLFIAAHQVAVRQINEFLALQEPHSVTIDTILTPLPANPLCWEVILVQLREQQYRLRRATFAVAPSWMSAQRCPNRDLSGPATAPLAAGSSRATTQWQWFGELTMPRAELARLVAKRCEAAAFVRFSRAPWMLRQPDGWLLGDLRYDREPQPGFSEIELSDAAPRCPRHVPSWVPPRAEVLR